MIRIKNTYNGLEANTDENFGLMVISQKITEREHNSIKESLKEIIHDDIKVDIFFKWNSISVIIFNTKFMNSKLRKSINSTLSKFDHAILFNGVIEGSNSLTDVYINIKKNCVQIDKKFSTLLILRKEIN